MTVRAAVEALEGVARVEASHRHDRVEVVFDPDRSSAVDIEHAIEEAGYEAEPWADGSPGGGRGAAGR